MKTVAFDGTMGASGDMLLGALVDAGADPTVFGPIEDTVGCAYEVEETTTHGVSATRVTVVNGRKPRPRSYADVTEIVDALELDAPADTWVRKAIDLLGEAEAAVHGTPLEETHFHEVGADDAIADIAGTAALLASLDPDRLITGPIATGSGEVETTHGIYPVPPPAVTAIAALTTLTLYGGPVEAELLTPTGAAILGAMAEGVDTMPSLSVSSVGYGVGAYEFADRPNILRAIVGTVDGALRREDIHVLETHVDDATPELLGYLQERLREVGALDIACVPGTMKKSRPGHVITVVVRPSDAARVARTLAVETGTLGVRSTAATHRWVADREIRSVTIDVGGQTYPIDVKVARDSDGTVFDRSAEFDDAASIARAENRPITDIMRLAEQALTEDDDSNG